VLAVLDDSIAGLTLARETIAGLVARNADLESRLEMLKKALGT
jgi:hypothetical protein